MAGVLRILNLVFLALYILSAAVQYNDPDPVRWMVIYGAAAAACLLAFRRGFPRWVPAVVGVASLVWALTLLPAVLGQVGLTEMFQERGMATMKIEEGREDIGLILVTVWMLALFFFGNRIGRSAAPGQAKL